MTERGRKGSGVSRDPLDNAEKSKGPNWYEYVKNRRVTDTEPLGLCSCKSKTWIISAYGSAGATGAAGGYFGGCAGDSQNSGPINIACGALGAGLVVGKFNTTIEAGNSIGNLSGKQVAGNFSVGLPIGKKFGLGMSWGAINGMQIGPASFSAMWIPCIIQL